MVEWTYVGAYQQTEVFNAKHVWLRQLDLLQLLLLAAWHLCMWIIKMAKEPILLPLLTGDTADYIYITFDDDMQPLGLIHLVSALACFPYLSEHFGK